MRFGLMLVLLCSLILAGCGEAEPPAITFDEIDMTFADAGSGEKLYSQSANGAPTCASCHVVEGSGGGIGPSLEGIASVAGSRVSGEDSTEYLYWSIVRPARLLVGGYSNVMYGDYDTAYEAADIADLIAYLQTLE